MAAPVVAMRASDGPKRMFSAFGMATSRQLDEIRE